MEKTKTIEVLNHLFRVVNYAGEENKEHHIQSFQDIMDFLAS